MATDRGSQAVVVSSTVADAPAAADARLSHGDAALASSDAGQAASTGMLLTWGGVNRFGSDKLTIDANRLARFEYRDGAGAVTSAGPLQLTVAELETLANVLTANHACALVSAPGYVPVPEETRTTLSVAFGGMRCVVSLYANEWRSQSAAAPIERAITAISARTQGTRP